MRTRKSVVVRLYDLNGNHMRTDKFSMPSNAGLWLSVNGFSVKGQAVEGRYTSGEGYALVEYEE